jgi:phosphoenolpyruvate carboxylase
MATYRVPIEQLRGDVRLLGQTLGEILVEQSGPELLELVERVRARAIADRDRGTPVDSVLVDEIVTLPFEAMAGLVRAFTLYFYLVNAAEENHRLRALRQRALANPQQPLPESIAAAVRSLAGHGVTAPQLQAFLTRLKINPVLTAHPSEARRRTVLQHLQRIGGLIQELDHTPDAAAVLGRIAEVLTLLWQTDQVRLAPPTPLHEVQTGLFFFDRTLFDVVPRIYRDVERALATSYPGETFALPPFLRFSSWIGGDRDGNPAVTNAVTVEALALQRATALGRYQQDVAQLVQSLSPSVRRVGVSAALLDAIARYADELGARGPVILARNPVEPYRQLLGLIAERLRRTAEPADGGYASADELIADLELMSDSLTAHQGRRIAAGDLEDLLWRVRVFRFVLAELEVRQHSAQHRAALTEIFRFTEVCPNYDTLSSHARTVLVATEIANPRPLIPAELPFSPATNQTIETFRTIREIQRRFGADACRTYIVSMTHDASDVLAVALLAKEAGLFELRPDAPPRAHLRVAPLFEGIDDLHQGPAILRELLQLPVYRGLVAASGDVQEIMLGYSDSNKDGGYLAANVALAEAQDRLAEVCAEHRVQIELFHGRGGAIGRGGGPMGRAIASLSKAAFGDRLKFTEQGEVIFSRYSNPGIAHRHLEQIVHAAFLAGLEPRPPLPAPTIARWRATLEDLASRALTAYRDLIDHTPGFEHYFRDSTPFPELAHHAIASRPVSRSSTTSLADIRAIPWVFSWTQSRANLPGWYGVGSAVASYLHDHPSAAPLLRTMYRDWPVFHSIVDNCQISLATTDMAVARLYRDAVSDPELGLRIYAQIDAEFERSRQAVETITGHRELLGPGSLLLQSIRLRNPYVDPMNVVQATLLRGLRRGGLYGDRRPVDLVLQTINGIAAGLQTTG